jgi:hypothetical protein
MGQPDTSGWRFQPKHQSALPLSLDFHSGEWVSLTRAVGDFSQSTSRLCHFRLIPILDLISILLRPARPFNALTTVPDRLAQTPISANPLKTLLEHS